MCGDAYCHPMFFSAINEDNDDDYLSLVISFLALWVIVRGILQLKVLVDFKYSKEV